MPLWLIWQWNEKVPAKNYFACLVKLSTENYGFHFTKKCNSLVDKRTGHFSKTAEYSFSKENSRGKNTK